MNIQKMIGDPLPTKEQLDVIKMVVFLEVTEKMKMKFIQRGGEYSALTSDIYENFRDFQEIGLVFIISLKLKRFFNKAMVLFKSGQHIKLKDAEDHIIDSMVYLMILYGLIKDREVNSF